MEDQATDAYQAIVDRNLQLLRELEALEKARISVMKQLGLSDERASDAALLQWLVRLYARRAGEARLLRRVRELLGRGA